MKYFYLNLIFILVSILNAKENLLQFEGELKIDKPYLINITEKPVKLLMISASDRIPSTDIIHNKIEYTIAVEDNVIKFISPNSNNFFTPEGFSLHTTLKTILEKTNSKLIKEAGWAFYVELPSEWNAAFTKGKYYTNETIKDDDQVSFFFKR